jgi:hypothetical protein
MAFRSARFGTHVDTDNTANHLWDDDHITQVSLDHCGLLVGSSVLLGCTELLDEAHGFTLESSLEPPSCSGVDKLHE